MDKEIISLIGIITPKVVELNSISEDDYFMSFSGHVERFDVYCIKGGYEEDGYNREELIDAYGVSNIKQSLYKLIEVLDERLVEEKSK